MLKENVICLHFVCVHFYAVACLSSVDLVGTKQKQTEHPKRTNQHPAKKEYDSRKTRTRWALSRAG